MDVKNLTAYFGLNIAISGIANYILSNKSSSTSFIFYLQMKNEAGTNFLSLDDIARELNLSRGSISIWASVFQQIKPSMQVNGVDLYSVDDLARFKEINDIKNSMDCSIQMVKKIIDKKGFFIDENLSSAEEIAKKDRREQQDGFELLKYALSGGIISSHSMPRKTEITKKSKGKQKNVNPGIKLHYFGENSQQPSSTNIEQEDQHSKPNTNTDLDKILQHFLAPEQSVKPSTNPTDTVAIKISTQEQERIMTLLRKIENIISDLN